MKFLTFTALFFSLTTFAQAGVNCVAGNHKFTIQSSSPYELKVTYKGETVIADGYINTDEIDFVAKFNSIGEMTLVANIGDPLQSNYVFIQGRRFPVICR